MCGIVGYIGDNPAAERVLEGLARLEYRGYDSAGVAYHAGDRLIVAKCKGRLSDIAPQLRAPGGAARSAIAHTRWATHGEPSDRNAHPHPDCCGRLAVVHNGIIENWRALRARLEREGHIFVSETDTEVLAHLVEAHLGNGSMGDLREAVRQALAEVEGSFALAVLSVAHPDRIVAARRGSPLVLGLGRGEQFLASDIPALLPFTRDEVIVEDDELVELRKDGFDIRALKCGTPTSRSAMRIEWDLEQAAKGGFPHYMLKEIHEQPRALAACIAGRLEDGDVAIDLGLLPDEVQAIDQVHLVACGTSRHAAMIGALALERFAGLPCHVEIGSEYRYRDQPLSHRTLGIAVSQSGETADTLAGLRRLGERGARTLAVCNVIGSSLARASERTVYIHAGPEISVASTKAFTTQVATLILTALELGRLRGACSRAQRGEIVSAIAALPELLARALPRMDEQAAALGDRLAAARFVPYIGRAAGFALALEGALKLKEIAYVPTEGYAAGELKHGPIALIEPGTPVVAVVPQNGVREKLLANLDEVRARGGHVITIATRDDEDAQHRATALLEVPGAHPLTAPIYAAVPLQLLAYHAARAAGHDVDKPRNLAKSVTVE
jgi:glucosamine--fructose-6-phosphate aminotransferase (isomerizing)